MNYQISPLEYKNREANEITLPHDNLPPYLKVYIWECIELTKEEMLITGELDNNTDNNADDYTDNNTDNNRGGKKSTGFAIARG